MVFALSQAASGEANEAYIYFLQFQAKALALAQPSREPGVCLCSFIISSSSGPYLSIRTTRPTKEGTSGAACNRGDDAGLSQ